MPKTRSIADYPHEAYGRILTAVARTKESQTIPCRTPMEAAALRGDLYAFRRATQGAVTKAHTMGIDPDLIAKVKIQVVKEPAGVRLYHIDDQPGVAAINVLLGQLGVPLTAAVDLGIQPEPDLVDEALASQDRILALYGMEKKNADEK